MKSDTSIICYCPQCKNNTHHSILAREEMSADSNSDFWWKSTFSIVKCLGCHNIQFHKEDVDESLFDYDEDGNQFLSSEVKTYPWRKDLVEPIKSWEIPSEISLIYKETMDCLNNSSFQLAAAGFRAVIERFCRYEKIDGKELNTMINNLVKKHIITKQDRDNLHAIRLMGNDTIHGLKQYSEREVVIVAHIVNAMLTGKYIIAEEVKYLDVIPVKSVSEFIEVLDKELATRKVGTVDVIRNFVKHERRIISEDISEFEKQLQEKIKDGSYTKLSLCSIPAQGCHQQYKVESN